MSDEERDQVAKKSDEDGAEDVEAHQLGKGAVDEATDEDSSDDVEAHKHATN